MILELSKNDLSQFISYEQKVIAEAKKNNLLKEFVQNFPSSKERKLYLKQDALSKAKNSDIWAKYVFREAYGINNRTLGDEYNIRKFYRAKNCVSLQFCKFTKVYGIIFQKISKYYISLQFRKIYVILQLKYYASFQYHKIYAILQSKYSANLQNCKPA
ncbi:hypothetical protein RclHR1_39530001 [Rhizophagus clarus]|uniref:Uncharacterized protein n=1 Tax=Rhizophagus clarus TaxID=94130 RepID=A0A2Z6RUL7_9GLOM|nr:hypothetical protein RclHR1_39530001 [Rhizophagus clarus]GES95202.1 hypothetical protein GLOIN_2v1874888 [Rhizophagus clarus]